MRDLGGAHAGRPYQLLIANRLFAQQGLKFEPQFTNTIRDDYGAPPESVDFAEVEATRARINAWVSEVTSSKIPEIFAPGRPTASTLVALANAIYFKASWTTAFEVKKTVPRPFRLTSGESVEVPMMNNKGFYDSTRAPRSTNWPTRPTSRSTSTAPRPPQPPSRLLFPPPCHPPSWPTAPSCTSSAIGSRARFYSWGESRIRSWSSRGRVRRGCRVSNQPS